MKTNPEEQYGAERIVESLKHLSFGEALSVYRDLLRQDGRFSVVDERGGMHVTKKGVVWQKNRKGER